MANRNPTFNFKERDTITHNRDDHKTQITKDKLHDIKVHRIILN